MPVLKLITSNRWAFVSQFHNRQKIKLILFMLHAQNVKFICKTFFEFEKYFTNTKYSTTNWTGRIEIIKKVTTSKVDWWQHRIYRMQKKSKTFLEYSIIFAINANHKWTTHLFFLVKFKLRINKIIDIRRTNIRFRKVCWIKVSDLCVSMTWPFKIRGQTTPNPHDRWHEDVKDICIKFL